MHLSMARGGVKTDTRTAYNNNYRTVHAAMVCQTYLARGQGYVFVCDDGGLNRNEVLRVRTKEENTEELVDVRVSLVANTAG